MRRRQSLWILGAALALVGMAGCRTPLIGGESAYCGDTSRLGFYYATFQTPRDSEASTKAVWGGSRRIRLGEPVGVGGADVTDLQVVKLGGGTTFNVGGGTVENGRPAGGTAEGSTGPLDTDSGPWRVDVVLTLEAGRRLSKVVQEISGSYQILAFVVGDQVFSASVDLPVRLGVARIELPETRARARGLAFLREQLGCEADPS